MSRNSYQTKFLTFFIIGAHKKGKNPKKGTFRPFLVFFKRKWKMANLPGCCSSKWTSDTGFRKFGSKYEDWDHKTPWLCKMNPGKKVKTCFLGPKKIRFSQFGPKCKNKAISHIKKFSAIRIWSQILKNGIFRALRSSFRPFLAIFMSNYAIFQSRVPLK